MLTYGDFYAQLKSTGFGECATAAWYLARRFRLAFSENEFSRFVAVVEEVRDEIRRKNPDNLLSGKQFESRYGGWLRITRFPANCAKFGANEASKLTISTYSLPSFSSISSLSLSSSSGTLEEEEETEAPCEDKSRGAKRKRGENEIDEGHWVRDREIRDNEEASSGRETEAPCEEKSRGAKRNCDQN